MPALDPALIAAVRSQLSTVRAAQGGTFTRAQALAAGLSDAQLRTLVRRGEWVALRHGWFADGGRHGPTERHRLECTAAFLASSGSAVVSRASTAVLHGLDVVEPPSRPTLTLPWQPGRTSRRAATVAVLPADHVVTRSGLLLTSPARTVVDLLRATTDELAAQALADVAAARVALADVVAVLDFCTGWSGVAGARAAWLRADPRAESPLESRCRVWFARGGLPVPESQVVVRGSSGEHVARVDFLFRAHRTIVEADGRLKYDDPQALWKEKLREDAIRELGLEVVRATWADGEDGGAALVARVRRAFARAARRGS